MEMVPSTNIENRRNAKARLREDQDFSVRQAMFDMSLQCLGKEVQQATRYTGQKLRRKF